MRRRLQLFIGLFAWFMATGSQWDLAQIVAWGRMFAGYSQEMSFSAALQKTFSGKRCRMCEIVQQGKKQQEESSESTPLAKASGKMFDLGIVPTSTPLFSPTEQAVAFFAQEFGDIGRGRASPPSPPPRV